MYPMEGHRMDDAPLGLITKVYKITAKKIYKSFYCRCGICIRPWLWAIPCS